MSLSRAARTVVALSAAAVTSTVAPAHAGPAADYEMPFPCRQEWVGSTRPSHSPSVHAVDWNRANDLGKRVVAAAPGTVTRVENLGSRSYGLYVVIDHGNGESTLYAHLSAELLSVGQTVDRGQLVGRVGESGNVSGPHLHFEERRDGTIVAPWFHGEPFLEPSTQRSRSCDDTPIAGDWTGDGKADVGVFRRKRTGRFLLDVNGAVKQARMFAGTDTPLVGDWDGNGVPDFGRHRATNRVFTLRARDGTTRSVRFGRRSDIGISGDWDGNGSWDLGVWRPRRATFVTRLPDGSRRSVALGSAGSLPATGDWDGDGRTDLAAYSAGTWQMWLQERNGSTWSASFELGSAGDLPVTGDWNGDGATDLGVWSPSTATFTLRKARPKSLRPGTLVTRTFGAAR